MSMLPPSDIIGDVFNPPPEIEGYIFIMRIAYGGSGEIFAAINAQNRLSCLKILHPHLASDTRALKNFEEEIEIYKRTDEPILPQFISSGKIEGRPYIETDLINGFDLARILMEFKKEKQVFSADAVVSILLPVALALKRFKFQYGLIHRDISPHNILIDSSGRVRIADLGIARDLKRESFTRTGEVKGKAAYMSPEQARGEKAGFASDVFSMGTVMFEMITGEALYTPENGDIWSLACKGEHNSNYRLGDDIPVSLKKLLVAMLDKSPDNRPSINEVITKLEETAEHCNIEISAGAVKKNIWPVTEPMYLSLRNKYEPYKNGFQGASPAVLAKLAKKKARFLLLISILNMLTVFIAALYKKAYF